MPSRDQVDASLERGSRTRCARIPVIVLQKACSVSQS
jgi:hypothetical protein